MSVDALEQSQFKDAIEEILFAHPLVIALVAKIEEDLPNLLVEGAKNYRWAIKKSILEKVKPTIDAIDIEAFVEAILSNESLRGEVIVELEDLAFGLSERIRSEINDYLSNEIARLQNLQTLRRSIVKTQDRGILQEARVLKSKQEVAKAKGNVLYYKLIAITGAFKYIVLFCLAAAAIGFAFGIYYPKAILCAKGDRICEHRIDGKVEFLPR
jgi:hypothetical protein